MSRALLRNVLSCRFCSNSTNNSIYCSKGLFSVFQYVNKCTRREEIGHALILIEDGSSIRELPIIVRKVSNSSVMFCENKEASLSALVDSEANKNSVDDIRMTNEKSIANENDVESKEIMEYFNKCYTARGIFAILETIPANEVTPVVALQALKRIVTLENNKALRNSSMGELYQKIDNDSASFEGLHENETFTRTAVLTQLVDKILSTFDADILLNGFLMVNRDIIGKYIDDENKTRFTNDILCRITDGIFTIQQTCEAIKVFSDISKDNVDKLWVGITEKTNDINKDNFMDVVRSIQYLNKSRKVVLSVIEKKLVSFWFTLNGHEVAETLAILKYVKGNSPRILRVLSQWVNKNIHTATEDDLIEIVNGFCSMDYNNSGIEQALERYVKVKGVSIKNPTLMATIMDYCSKFRIRSPVLLQGSAEYLVLHGTSLSPVLLQRLFLPLGELNYQPTNGFNFWQVLEVALGEKFVQFRPEEAISMLLHCVFLKKYPLNFVKKVFNPYFLDRLHSYKNKEIVKISRSRLQVLDLAMTLECPYYEGPILPKTISTSPIWLDGRIKRMTNNIRNILEDIAGEPNRVACNVVPAKLPAIDIYVIDALLLSRNVGMWTKFINLEKDFNMHTAVVIHPPEHYCSNGHHLTGRQEMRIRHLRHIGLKVVSLNLDELAKLRVHPRALRCYIEERLQEAYPPIPKIKL